MKTARRVTQSIVSLAQDGEASGLCEKALRLLPLDQIIRPQDTVVIKPNFVSLRSFNKKAITKPEVLRAVIRIIKDLNPSRIIVAEGSGGSETERVLNFAGADRVIKEEGVEFVDLNDPPVIEAQLQHDRPSTIKLNKIVEEMDVLISLAVLKMHNEATITAGMKNIALSFPPGDVYGLPKADVSGIPSPTRMDLHADLHGFIVAMNKLLPIDVTLIDATDAMIGTGPVDGNPMPGGTFIAGTDPVATDTVAAHLMGFMPQAVRYLWQAIGDGMGEGRLGKIEFRGGNFDEVAKVFTRRVFGKEFVVR